MTQPTVKYNSTGRRWLVLES